MVVGGQCINWSWWWERLTCGRLTCGIFSIIISRRRRRRRNNNSLLPDDIICEIISRLHPQQVLKFGRLSKKWGELISTQSFREMNYRNNQTPLYLFAIQCFHLSTTPKLSNSAQVLVINDNPNAGFIRSETVNFTIVGRTNPYHLSLYKCSLVSSYKGMLLFRHDSKEELILIFYNPITGVQVTVNAPASRYLYFGFYFHSPSEEYRVLYGVLLGDEQDACIGFALLGLRTRSLRRIIMNFSHRPSSSTPPVISNGALHWMVSETAHGDQEQVSGVQNPSSCSRAIMSFGMESEEFQVMPHPGGECHAVVSGVSHDHKMRLMQMEDHLCLCVCSGGSFPAHDKLDIWVLEEYEEWIWVRRHVVMLRSLLASFSPPVVQVEEGIGRRQTINGLFIHDCELLLKYWKLNEIVFFLYHLKKGTLRRLQTPNLGRYTHFGHMVVLHPSIVSFHSTKIGGYVLSLHDDQVAQRDLEQYCPRELSIVEKYNLSIRHKLLKWKKDLLN